MTGGGMLGKGRLRALKTESFGDELEPVAL